MAAKNFAISLWTRFQEHKERPALVRDDKEEPVLTFWTWTRQIQRLALGLLDAGLETGDRMALIAPGSGRWLTLAMSTWLAGGVVVPLPSGAERRPTLRRMARSGCRWIAVADQTGLDAVRGGGDKLPPDLRWILLQSEADDPIHAFDALENTGRELIRRGHLERLGERSFALDPAAPALVLFDPAEDQDPHGAWFQGQRLAQILDNLADDLALHEDDRLASVVDLAAPEPLLLALAALWSGQAACDTESGPLQRLAPTVLVCRRRTLEEQAARRRKSMEQAPSFLRRMAGEEGGGAETSLPGLLGKLGHQAAHTIFYRPMIDELGGAVRRIYLVGPPLSEEVRATLQAASLEVLGCWGLPESGLSHVERPGAERPGSVGRPVQGVVCVVEGDRGERQQPGPILLRGESLFDGYWDEQGPRTRDDEGWLHTDVRGRLASGYLFLQRPTDQASG